MHEGPRMIMKNISGWVGVMMAGSLLVCPLVWGQGLTQPVETKTIIGDLLMVDGDFYIVRGQYGEIQIEATPKTQVTEEFTYGDKIKALVLNNNKALRIERAGANAPTGVVTNQPTTQVGGPQSGRGGPVAAQPDTKTIVADLLMVDGNFYIVRSDYGEIQIETTPKSNISGTFTFGDRIKAVVLMNNQALSIGKAGPKDVPGIIIHKSAASGDSSHQPPPSPSLQGATSAGKGGGAKAAAGKPGKPSAPTRVVEGDVLMVDGDLYILRGPEGEIRIERTDKTRMTEEFDFGDRIRATVLENDKAVSIERAQKR